MRLQHCFPSFTLRTRAALGMTGLEVFVARRLDEGTWPLGFFASLRMTRKKAREAGLFN
jgi:hypothetical protein